MTKVYDSTYFKKLAKTLRPSIEGGVRASDFFALAPKNDPFNCGTPAQVRDARWFKRVFDLVNFGEETLHLRRVHYRILSLPEEQRQLPYEMTGTDESGYQHTFFVYENHQRCWDFLTEASKSARYLGYIASDVFVDNRAKEVSFTFNTNWYSAEDRETIYPLRPAMRIRTNNGDDDWTQELPEVAELPDFPEPDALPVARASGYYIEQGVHIEIWIEKSEGEDVFLPLCEEYRVNFVPGVGDMSITTVYRLLERIKEAGKPAVILYVSDFDPSGKSMPIGVARKIEFMIATETEFEGLEVSLEPVMLTQEQVEYYDLPPVPIKDSDHRKGVWESKYGGGVELNALFATRERIEDARAIVREWLDKFYDRRLWQKEYQARQELQEYLDEVTEEVHADHQGEIEEFSERWQEVAARWVSFQDEYRSLMEQFADEIEEIKTDLHWLIDYGESVYEGVKADLRRYPMDEERVPEVPEAEFEGNPASLMFHSGRQYFEQMVEYSRYRNDGYPDTILVAVHEVLEKEGGDNGTTGTA